MPWINEKQLRRLASFGVIDAVKPFADHGDSTPPVWGVDVENEPGTHDLRLKLWNTSHPLLRTEHVGTLYVDEEGEIYEWDEDRGERGRAVLSFRWVPSRRTGPPTWWLEPIYR